MVLDDADLDADLEGAMIAKMRSGGEACTAANGINVADSIADKFADRLTRAMGAMVMGAGAEPGVTFGPLVNASTRDKVAELVDDAVTSGALVTTGGSNPGGPGFFYPPAVLTNVAADAAILQTETFGPVAPIVTFSPEEEAIELANGTEYGLVGYVNTGELARGLRVSERIEAGMVGLNRGLVSDPAAPFGGVKDSGSGRDGGVEGLLAYTECKYIAVSW